MIIVLKDIPKISLNVFYAGIHWKKRKNIKDQFTYLVKSQYRKTIPKTNKYEVTYDFEFKLRPLDASNTMGMVKMIEDILFDSDKWDVVKKITLTSNKGKEDKITINIKKIK
tara:strand:- start:344 stop:679 length:336 start_codon:yes stop_codon:yes gene_type:complete